MPRLPRAALFVTLLAGPALAHHPLGGQPMQTFAHGILSGIGHPLLGFDHLFFVIAVGIASATLGRLWTGPLVYLVAMAAGCAVAPLPATEAMIALSLLALGTLLVLKRHGQALLALLAGFGLFHGAAFGASILGQEGGAALPVWAGYLAGLIAVQYAIAITAGRLGRHHAAAPRFVGAAVAGVGLFLTLEMIEAPLIALITG